MARHYDARNYKPINGWVLASEPQQQLFYDINEDTNELIGINGTDSDEITFFYRDVRILEVPKNGKTPDGYVRVTFKAGNGGSFGKDNDGNPITELHYDVVEGTKSNQLPVPQELPNGASPVHGKYYVTPNAGLVSQGGITIPSWLTELPLGKQTKVPTSLPHSLNGIPSSPMVS